MKELFPPDFCERPLTFEKSFVSTNRVKSVLYEFMFKVKFNPEVFHLHLLIDHCLWMKMSVWLVQVFTGHNPPPDQSELSVESCQSTASLCGIWACRL